MAQNRKILIVDDDRAIVETIKFNFEAQGYEVIEAFDAYGAVGAAIMEQPSAMILDVMLPQKNGYEVSRVVKGLGEKLKPLEGIAILILTARKLDDPEREDFFATWSRADGFMYKPFEMQELIERIEALIRAKEGPALL